MIKKVKGIYNGCAKNSIFAFNPRGWIGGEVEIDFPYPEETLEEAYKNAILKSPTRLFQYIVVNEVEIIENE